MKVYKVTRYLDLYKPGDIAGADYIAEQTKRGNMDDLVRKGVLTIADYGYFFTEPEQAPATDYDAMTLNELRALAKRRGVKPGGRKKADYVTALEQDDR